MAAKTEIDEAKEKAAAIAKNVALGIHVPNPVPEKKESKDAEAVMKKSKVEKVYENKTLLSAGHIVSIPHNRQDPKVGDIIELRYVGEGSGLVVTWPKPKEPAAVK